MQLLNSSRILVKNQKIHSRWLHRDVKVDYYHSHDLSPIKSAILLLINDGQDLEKLDFASILGDFFQKENTTSLICVALHAGEHRKMEYGVAAHPDYLGRGADAGRYQSFIINELLPWIAEEFPTVKFIKRAYAGFSLGGLSALDIVWNHPALFSSVGVFSGSLWWRSVAQEEHGYEDDRHRIIHQQIKKGHYDPRLKFFFQCGNKDETMDRNNNGIIDSIDDTRDLIAELLKKGYREPVDIHYLEMPDGRHDVETWGKAMKVFLPWLVK